MIVPLLRHVADRLTHPTTGYEALRASVPKDAADAAPPLIPSTRVLTAADKPLFALGPIDESLLADGPAFLVTHVSTTPGATPWDSASVTVAVRYVAEPTDTFAFDAYQALWAAGRSLLAPVLSAGQSGQVAFRNGVEIGAPSLPVFVEPPADGAAAEAFVPALAVTYPLRSPWLLGA